MAHFLIADDEQPIRQGFRLLLESEGHTCEEAGNLIEVIKTVKNSQSSQGTPFELVLLDYNFGGNTGIEIIKHLGNDYCKDRVIVITGDRTRSLPKEFASLGIKWYLIKPVQEELFWANIDVALSYREQLAWQENPNASLVFLDKNRKNFTLSDLRKELGFDRILAGKFIKSVVYSDRYLNSKGASILADFLLGNWLDKNSFVTLRVLENSREKSASQLKSELERSLIKFTNAQVPFQVKVQPVHHRAHFCHYRLLEITMEDDQKYVVAFDVGMDFLETSSSGTYNVTQPTYVAVATKN